DHERGPAFLPELPDRHAILSLRALAPPVDPVGGEFDSCTGLPGSGRPQRVSRSVGMIPDQMRHALHPRIVNLPQARTDARDIVACHGADPGRRRDHYAAGQASRPQRRLRTRTGSVLVARAAPPSARTSVTVDRSQWSSGVVAL